MSKRAKKTKPDQPCVQYGALVWRRAKAELEVLLVTSRDTGRWIVPKGWPMHKRAPHRTAALEALEEAGVVGKISPDAVGHFRYVKRLKDGVTRLCTVELFPLKAKEEHRRWREKDQRVRRWFPAAEAAELVDEPELRELILGFAPA